MQMSGWCEVCGCKIVLPIEHSLVCSRDDEVVE